jgi:hypothetical protein
MVQKDLAAMKGKTAMPRIDPGATPLRCRLSI